MPSILPPAERRSVVLVATYVALSLVLLVVGDHLPVAWSRGIGAFIFEPFDRMVLTGDRLFAAWRENSALHERITRLEIETALLRQAGAENRRLRVQLGLPAGRLQRLIPVEVLALGGDPTPTSATLSGGTTAGIHVGDVLLTSEGLVGRVSEAWPHLSRAVLLTDPNLTVACAVETSGVNGILRFSSSPGPHLVMTAVPLADTLRVGERIVSSDLSLRFPRGIPVGRVVRVRNDANGLMQEAEIAPAAQLSRLRHAFVTPGPGAPVGGGYAQPHLEFEPQRIAATRGVIAHPDSARHRRPPARSDSTGVRR